MQNSYSFDYSVPCLMSIKNADSTYVHMTDYTARLLGWNNRDDCIGKTDYDIPCEAVRFAKKFIVQDQKVIQSRKKMITLDMQQYKEGQKLLLTDRVYLESDEIFTQCIDVSDTIIYQNYVNLFQLDMRFSNKSAAVSYILNSDHCPFLLTEKQRNCLFLLIRGKTVKEVASIVKLSPRTVEDHIDAMKSKLHCFSKRELVEKSINEGFLHYIPDQFQKNPVSL